VRSVAFTLLCRFEAAADPPKDVDRPGSKIDIDSVTWVLFSPFSHTDVCARPVAVSDANVSLPPFRIKTTLNFSFNCSFIWQQMPLMRYNVRYNVKYKNQTTPADCDCDLDVDADDLGIFEACGTGPVIPYDYISLPADCDVTADANHFIPVDFDEDGDVDQEDFGAFQRCFSGGLFADPSCGK
jgi:hypothetical protein